MRCSIHIDQSFPHLGDAPPTNDTIVKWHHRTPFPDPPKGGQPSRDAADLPRRYPSFPTELPPLLSVLRDA